MGGSGTYFLFIKTRQGGTDMNGKFLFSIFQVLLVMTFLGPAQLSASQKEATTLAELETMFDESHCMECHEETHSQ